MKEDEDIFVFEYIHILFSYMFREPRHSVSVPTEKFVLVDFRKIGLKIPVTCVTYVTCSDKAGIFGPL